MFAWNDENHPDGIKALKSAGLEFFQYIKTIDYKVLMSITSIQKERLTSPIRLPAFWDFIYCNFNLKFKFTATANSYSNTVTNSMHWAGDYFYKFWQ